MSLIIVVTEAARQDKILLCFNSVREQGDP
jgi:hypothetical protein